MGPPSPWISAMVPSTWVGERVRDHLAAAGGGLTVRWEALGQRPRALIKIGWSEYAKGSEHAVGTSRDAPPSVRASSAPEVVGVGLVRVTELTQPI